MRLIVLIIGLAFSVSLAQEAVLFDFATPEATAAWYSVDDVVMGGVSASRLRFLEGSAQFTGDLSLENNGGFASVRFSAERFNLSTFNGVELRVKGDNKTYQFRFQTDVPRISYQQSFMASDSWTTVRLPFSDFSPVFFGRPVINAPTLNTADLRTAVLMISDKQVGEFELLVDWVKAY